ncbi:hypothetical protein AB0J25_27210 [Streptomyces sp. NPDC049910]|uniref:hypothetical protein n=1 Tax=Streptomyces sp. NPDC049910 TaxID=3155278 RepID=UPI0034304167
MERHNNPHTGAKRAEQPTESPNGLDCVRDDGIDGGEHRSGEESDVRDLAPRSGTGGGEGGGKRGKREQGVRAGKAASYDLTQARGVLIGDYGRQVNRFILGIPRSLRITIILATLLALLAGAAWIVVEKVLPEYAPTYKTEFLVDVAEGAEDVAGIGDSLRTVLGNSGDSEAMALRTFGGECGSKDNTTRHVDFGTGNRQQISEAAGALSRSGKPTLMRGIVEAVEDFSRPFGEEAKQVNRIIVITRHGQDACDPDTAFVEREIRTRLAAAGLAIDFRLIGYQVPDEQRERLQRLATGANAPEPSFAETPEQLNDTLDWFTNVEPLLRNSQEVISILNPPVEQVNRGVKAITEGRLDTAETTLAGAREAMLGAEVEVQDLAGRAKTPEARDLHAGAVRLRTLQQDVVTAAGDALDAARAGEQLKPTLGAYEEAANEYNDAVAAMNTTLAVLRARSP